MPRAQCKVEGCAKDCWGRGLCSMHYQRWRKHGDPTVEPDHPKSGGRPRLATQCSIEGCDEGGEITRGWCRKHYGRWRRWGDPLGTQTRAPVPCSVEGCDRDDHCKGLCVMHYNRQRTTGEIGDAKPLRAAAGVGHVNIEGYHRITVNGRHKAAHRHVMEQMLGRELRAFEQVHHINGVKSDNRPENLELWASHPKGQRVADLVEFVALNYPEEVMKAISAKGNA